MKALIIILGVVAVYAVGLRIWHNLCVVNRKMDEQIAEELGERMKQDGERTIVK